VIGAGRFLAGPSVRNWFAVGAACAWFVDREPAPPSIELRQVNPAIEGRCLLDCTKRRALAGPPECLNFDTVVDRHQ